MAHRLPNPAFLSNPTILLVKTSSLGDVLHNLPVASDIARHFPGAQIGWLVEESFAALPRLHPAAYKACSRARCRCTAHRKALPFAATPILFHRA